MTPRIEPFTRSLGKDRASAFDTPVQVVVAREPETTQLQHTKRARPRRRDGEELFREISARFLVETPRHLRAARTCVRRDNADGLRRLALSLHDATIRMGAACMADLCDALGEAAAVSHLARAGRLLDELRAEFAGVRVSMERELSTREEAGSEE